MTDKALEQEAAEAYLKAQLKEYDGNLSEYEMGYIAGRTASSNEWQTARDESEDEFYNKWVKAKKRYMTGKQPKEIASIGGEVSEGQGEEKKKLKVQIEDDGSLEAEVQILKYEKDELKQRLEQLSSQEAKAIAEKAIDKMFNEICPWLGREGTKVWKEAKAEYLSQFSSPSSPIK